jgi:hypothetical protein
VLAEVAVAQPVRGEACRTREFAGKSLRERQGLQERVCRGSPAGGSQA